jgi:flavodoxin
MARILIVYYSMYGHVERMAYAVAEGVDSVEGCGAVVKRVHELIPEDVARKSGVKLDQDAPFVTVDELPQYDGMIFGSPTRYGNACAQIRNFIDQTGGLWLKGRLEGKAVAACSRPPRPNTAARKPPAPPCTRRFCTSACWSWACPIRARGCRTWTRSLAVAVRRRYPREQ